MFHPATVSQPTQGGGINKKPIVMAKPIADSPLKPVEAAQPLAVVPAVTQAAPVITPVYSDSGDLPGILASIKGCESSGNYANNDTGGNGHFGAYQFSLSTWASVGGSGNPADASPAEQDMRALILYNQDGTGPWTASEGCWGS